MGGMLLQVITEVAEIRIQQKIQFLSQLEFAVQSSWNPKLTL